MGDDLLRDLHVPPTQQAEGGEVQGREDRLEPHDGLRQRWGRLTAFPFLHLKLFRSLIRYRASTKGYATALSFRYLPTYSFLAKALLAARSPLRTYILGSSPSVLLVVFPLPMCHYSSILLLPLTPLVVSSFTWVSLCYGPYLSRLSAFVQLII